MRGRASIPRQVGRGAARSRGRNLLPSPHEDLTLTYLCGPAAGASFTMGYTATPTQLVLISPPGSVETLTKQ